MLDRWQPSKPVLLGITAVIIGLASGAGVWLFKTLIELAQTLFFGQVGGALAALGRWTVAILPVLGAASWWG